MITTIRILGYDAKGAIMEGVHISNHLTIEGRVNLGSYYTPAKYVSLVGEWLIRSCVSDGWTIADLSSGYGAFFELSTVPELNRCRYVANDIDPDAVRKGREFFPNVEWQEKNALIEVSREKFGFRRNEPLVIVGNPPYNDTTSQANNHIKSGAVAMDPDIRTRDLGMSSLLLYNKLEADYVAVLHPLSYLIKRANFSATSKFFNNYVMLDHIIFSSSEFTGTSRVSAFPVVVAFYMRREGEGITYEDVKKMRFTTVEGDTFCVSSFDYVTDHISKYPHKERYKPEILFYTMRDINALKRSRTFLSERIANAVDVDVEKLPYYCYVDCFKRFAKVPYWMGNFDVPYRKDLFEEYKDDIVEMSKSWHPEVFGRTESVSKSAEKRVREYVELSLQSKE